MRRIGEVLQGDLFGKTEKQTFDLRFIYRDKDDFEQTIKAWSMAEAMFGAAILANQRGAVNVICKPQEQKDGNR